jgi:hypothetical protein
VTDPVLEWYLLPIYRQMFYRFQRIDQHQATVGELVPLDRFIADKPAPDNLALLRALRRFPCLQAEEVLLLLIAAPADELEGRTSPADGAIDAAEWPYATLGGLLTRIGQFFRTRFVGPAQGNSFRLTGEEAALAVTQLRMHHVQAVYPLTQEASEMIVSKMDKIPLENPIFEAQAQNWLREQRHDRARKAGRALLGLIGTPDEDIAVWDSSKTIFRRAALAGREAWRGLHPSPSGSAAERFVTLLMQYKRFGRFGSDDFSYLFDIAQIWERVQNPGNAAHIDEIETEDYRTLKRLRSQSPTEWPGIVSMLRNGELLPALRKPLTHETVQIAVAAYFFLRLRDKLGQRPVADTVKTMFSGFKNWLSNKGSEYVLELGLASYLLGIFYSFENLYDGIYAARDLPVLLKKKNFPLGSESSAVADVAPEPSIQPAAKHPTPTAHTAALSREVVLGGAEALNPISENQLVSMLTSTPTEATVSDTQSSGSVSDLVDETPPSPVVRIATSAAQMTLLGQPAPGPVPPAEGTASAMERAPVDDTGAYQEAAPYHIRITNEFGLALGPQVTDQAAELPGHPDPLDIRSAESAQSASETGMPPEGEGNVGEPVPGWLADLGKEGPRKVKNLGQKGIKDIWQHLRPEHQGALLTMCRDGRVGKLKNFGKQTVDALAEALSPAKPPDGDLFNESQEAAQLPGPDQLVLPDGDGEVPIVERVEMDRQRDGI